MGRFRGKGREVRLTEEYLGDCQHILHAFNKGNVPANVPVNVAKNVAKNLTERQKQIIALVSENPQTTRAEIATAIGVAIKTIERELANLSDIVRYVGPKKGGYWEILND